MNWTQNSTCIFSDLNKNRVETDKKNRHSVVYPCTALNKKYCAEEKGYTNCPFYKSIDKYVLKDLKYGDFEAIEKSEV